MSQKERIDAYFITLVLLAISLPFSKFTLSLSQLFLILVWLSDGFVRRFSAHQGNLFARFLKAWLTTWTTNLRNKPRLFLRNRTAIVLASLFLLHLIGLLYTSDFDYAIKDIRTKLPLFFLPFIMSSMSPLSVRKTKLLLGFFVTAVFVGTLISFVVYLQQNYTDIREISLFISSIRFSLTIVFSIFIIMVALLRYHAELKWWMIVLLTSLIIWFSASLMLLESAIGFLSLVGITTAFFLVRSFYIRNLTIRWLSISLCIIIPLSAVLYIADIIRDLRTPPSIDFSTLPSHSELGNEYRHDTIHFGIEDGRYVGIYFAESEMAEAWNKRSSYDFYGTDDAGQLIMYTIIRYLTSKDLRKDASGVNALCDQDIEFIQRGVANIRYMTQPSIRTRISKTLLGYQNLNLFSDPNGSSDMQRIEYLRASLYIIRNNLWFGVGTGDLPMHFKQAYDSLNTPLKEQWRWRSHNQYLSVLIAFGILGLLWFLFTLIYPAVHSGRYRDALYMMFLALMMFSMLTEDTIETQIGVSLFAFFNAFFLLSVEHHAKQSDDRKEF